MLELKGLWTPPVFQDDEDKTRTAQVLNVVLLSLMGVMLLAGIATLFVFAEKLGSLLVIIVLVSVLLAARVLMARGRVRWASALLVTGLWVGVTILVSLAGGMTSIDAAYYIMITVIAGLLLGTRAAAVVAIVCSLTGLAMVIIEGQGYPLPRVFPVPARAGWLNLTFGLFLATIALNVTLRSLRDALTLARQRLAERAEAEAALRQSEARFRGVVEHAHDGIALVDEQGYVVAWNQALEKVTGLKAQEVQGQRVWDVQFQIYPPERRTPQVYEQYKTGLLEFLRTGQAPWANRVMERDYAHPDGSHRMIQGQVFAVKTDTGFMLVSVSRDVTEAKRAEEALRESETRYRLISKVASDYMFSTRLDADGKLALNWVAGAFEAITGYTFEEYVAHGGWRATLHPDDLAVDDRDMEKLRANQPVVTQVRTLTKSGRVVWVQVYAHPVWDAERKELVGIYGAVQDITERKRAEEALQESEDKHRQLFELESDAVFLIDNETEQILEANTAASALYGYTRQELLCKKNSDLSAEPEETQRVTRSTPVITDQVVFIPLRFHRKRDGAVFPVEITGRFFTWRERPVHIAAIRDITVRLQAEEELRRQREDYQTILNTIPEIVWYLDRDGGIVRANKAALGIMGIAADEILGKTVFDLFPKEQAEQFHRDNVLVMESRQPKLGIVEQYRSGFGELRWASTDKLPYFDAQGQVVGIVIFVSDITERKQAEAQIERTLRETRVRLEVGQALAGAETEDQVLDVLIQHAGSYPQAHVSILTFGRTGSELAVILRRQDTFESGLTVTLPTGMRFPASSFTTINLFHSDQPFVSNDIIADERVDSATRKLFRPGGAASHAVFPLTAGNEWMGYIGVTAKPAGYFDEEKQHLYQTLAEQGAVALRAAHLRETIRESQQRLSLVVQQSPLAVIEWDTDYRAVAWNPAAEKIFGYTHEQALGERAADLIVPEDERPQIDQVWQTLLTQEGGTHSINNNLTRDGRRITCEWFNAPLVVADGQVIGVVSLVEDITERQQAQAEREKLILDLEARNAELERFTYTVSHDLKSPLVTIRGFLGFIEQDALAGNVEQMKQDMTRIVNATDKMQQLLGELLELSRIGRLMNPPEETPLDELAREAVNTVAGRLAMRGVHVEIAPDLPVVYGDRTRLREVLENLLDNAVKFMGDQPHPRIQIGMRQGEALGTAALSTAAETVLYVRDNGMGIDPRYHDKVFGLFEKLDPNVEGTGVGLAIVKRILEVHGGRIWVESEGTGKGSTFCFTLPDSRPSTKRNERRIETAD